MNMPRCVTSIRTILTFTTVTATTERQMLALVNVFGTAMILGWYLSSGISEGRGSPCKQGGKGAGDEAPDAEGAATRRSALAPMRTESPSNKDAASATSEGHLYT
jgi:hypothetical protein